MSFAAKTLVAFLLVIALIPATQAADPPRTGIGNQMTEMFDTMLNYTEPTAHLGQRRGVLTGGSLNARNRIMNESLWHFVPPSFDAGCGGIDLFAAAMTDTGFADPLQTLISVRKGTLSRIALGSANSPTPEADIERSFINYVSDCTLYDVDIGNRSIDDILRDPIWDTALRSDLNVPTTELVLGGDPQLLPCDAAWIELSDYTTVEFYPALLDSA